MTNQDDLTPETEYPGADDENPLPETITPRPQLFDTSELRGVYAEIGATDEPEPETPAAPAVDDPYGGLDIEAALASMAGLGDMMAEQRAADEAAAAEVKAEMERAAREAAKRPKRALQSPPPMVLRRGQPGSVLPALALIGVGAWLTFSLAAPGSPLSEPSNIGKVLLGVGVFTLFAQWFSSGRWPRGLFFVGLIALVLGLLLVVPLQVAQFENIAVAGSMLALGLGYIFNGLIGRPTNRRFLLPGVIFIAVAALAFVINTGILPLGFMAGFSPYWPVVLAVVLLIMLLPTLRKRRG